MKKIVAVTLSVILIVAGFTVGCTKSENKGQMIESGKTTQEKRIEDSSSDKIEEKKETEDSKSKGQDTTASGVYSGQIDANSIEVSIDGIPTAFFFSESVKDGFNSKTFKKGDEIVIQYNKNDNGQLILEAIKMK
jgi:hypothetical protein